MVVTIASGKGGTGKTTVSVNLASALASRGEAVQLLDCDVEEPNDHLFVSHTATRSIPVTVPKPVCDPERCTGCGICASSCNYHAIAVVKGTVLMYPELCHSCGVCAHVCPERAISEVESPIGTVEIAEGTPFPFAYGSLNVAESLAPNVVRAVKQHIVSDAINIIDASPGTACPVVEACAGADVALLVTEPTPFGLHDLKLACNLTLSMGIPTAIVINRSDRDDTLIEEYAARVGVPIAGRIPFDRRYAACCSEGQLLTERFPEVTRALCTMWDHLAAAAPDPVPVERFDIRAADAGLRDNQSEGDDRTDGATTPVAREITVISGKGGTGKTTLTASLAHLIEHKTLIDADVDASDLHLLLRPRVHEVHEFVGGVTASIDPARCAGCGLCAEACHFDAIRDDGPAGPHARVTMRIDPFACEGCGLCPIVCPHDAVSTGLNTCGEWFVSSTDLGPMVHARLGVAEENSGRLVSEVRRRASGVAQTHRNAIRLADGPPGTGCPVIASVSGTDLVVIVTEPTVSGVHDLIRVLDLADHFGVPTAVVINKADVNEQQARRITALANERGSSVIGTIPFDRAVHDALMAGKAVIETGDSAAAESIRAIWHTIEQRLRVDTDVKKGA